MIINHIDNQCFTVPCSLNFLGVQWKLALFFVNGLAVRAYNFVA